MSRPRVTVVSDYICPWCYLGLARVERLQRAVEIDIDWRPFELHPEIPTEGKVLGGRAGAYYDRLRAPFEAERLPFQPPTRVPNSHLALEAAEFAREQGAFDAYHRALFEAYFGKGRDIGDPRVLADLGAGQGLNHDELRSALEARRYAAVVDERTEASRQEGVSGTPTFVFEAGGQRLPIVGAQEYELFENVARRLGAASRNEHIESRAGARGPGGG